MTAEPMDVPMFPLITGTLPDKDPACGVQESKDSQYRAGRRGRIRCNRPANHGGPHRHYTRKAEIVEEWAP